jgi:SprT protein
VSRAARQLALPFDAVAPEAREARRERVRALTRELVVRAREQWPKKRIPDVKVAFGLRGHAAGDACARTATTRYNDELLDRYGDEFVRTIVPHEVAHVVTWAVFGRVKPHGPEWRDVMRFFGAPPRVTHEFETTPARVMRRFRYRCACPDPHLMTKRAHLRIRRGTAEYRCRRCGEALVWVESRQPGRGPGRS